MDITKENIDDLNAVVKINITEDDYQNKVAEILQDYRKKANIPGFRKGRVPMSLVKKQYEKPVLIDEVNKLLQESLSKFLVEEKLDILGNPLPKTQDDFSWDADQFSFEFELGLVPEFEVNLQPKKAITSYKIVADKKMLDDQVKNIQERYGKMITQSEITKDSNITGTFVNEEKEIEKKSTFKLDKVKGKTNSKLFIGAKVGDVITLKTKGLFTDDYLLQNHLGVSHDDVHDLDTDVQFTVEEISETEVSELNQELFNKLFGEGIVRDEKEFRKRLKEDAEKQFEQQSDQQLLNAVTEGLIENTKFDLPAEFLQKWIAVAGEKQLTEQEAEEEYKRSEKGLRYQLIEGKISKDNNLQVTFEELKEFAKGFIKSQMAQYGNANPEEKELEEIAGRILGNQEEAKRLSEQLMSQKLLTFYKENVKLKTKEVSFDDFVKEVYK
ncbi:trigger factor [Aureibaculum conchae]|uniref:trigger factor n=1 Tax=Aureibaculum sp. 2308TA14-22 TaxID=3108392 RepID=UPI0033918CD6